MHSVAAMCPHEIRALKRPAPHWRPLNSSTDIGPVAHIHASPL